MNRVSLLLLLGAVCLASCTKAASPINPTEKQPPERPAKIAACSLVNAKEVGEIQGATMTEPLSSEASDGNILTSHCYYGSTVPNASVSLTVIQRDPAHPSKRAPSVFWREIFNKSGENKPGEEGEAEEKEKREKEGSSAKNEEEEAREKFHPQKISGIGEEAFWMGGRIGSTLYVLKNDVILRVSFGGMDTAEKKLEKSKALAMKALTRL